MEKFNEIFNNEDLDNINGGGFLSMVAGTVAGAMIGSLVTLPYAVYKHDIHVTARSAIAGGSVGGFVGSGCPLP